LLYYCGYQEGSTASYNVVTVKGDEVQVDWHTLGKGVVRSYKWSEPGNITDLKVPEKEDLPSLNNINPDEIEQAWLYTAIWTDEDSVRSTIFINGTEAGELLLNKSVMAYSPFWNKVEIKIKDAAFESVSLDNEVSFNNPDNRRFGIAHTFLFTGLKDGTFIKSNVSPVILTSFKEHKGITNFPDAELVESVDLGSPLAKVALKLDKVVE
jgi:hypothetical protein